MESTEIIDQLRKRVLYGQWTPGIQIASERMLCEEFQVCGATIKKSLKELEREGLIWSKRGKGRFVSNLQNRRKTWSVGVLTYNISYITNPREVAILEGINSYLRTTDYHLNLLGINSNSNTSNHTDFLQSWLRNGTNEGSVDGIIIETKHIETSRALDLASHVPVVWINHPTMQPGLMGVRMDYLGGTYAATRYLLEQGHRRIVLVTTQENLNVGREQKDGFNLAVDYFEGKGDVAAKVYQTKLFSTEEGVRVAKEIIKADDQPTAVISGSERLTLGIYQVFSQAEKRIPEDVSLISCLDTISTDQIPVPLTVIHGNLKELGYLSAKCIVEQIEDPSQIIESERVPMELIIRDSVREL